MRSILFFLFALAMSYSGLAQSFKTKEVRVDINDWSSIKTPVRTFSGTRLSVKAAKAKAGILTKSQALSVICIGDFNAFGYIANDLYRNGGKLNTDFYVSSESTLMDVCHQQERQFALQQERLRARR